MSAGELRKKKRDGVVSLLRSCLMSVKGGVELERLNRDYRELVGDHIPWRDLGYNSLVEFLDQGRDFCRVSYSREGTILLHAVATEETAHIAHMVSQQRSLGKKRARPGMPNRRPMISRGWNPPGQRGVGMYRPPQQPRRLGVMARPFPTAGGMGYRPAGTPQFPPAAQRQPQRPPQQLMGVYYNNNNNNSNNRSSAAAPTQAPSQVKRPVASPPQQQQPVDNRDVDDLKRYCAANRLGAPEFKTSLMANKHFVSVALVGGRRYQTFPSECPSAGAAENAAAKIALEELKKMPDWSDNSANSSGPSSSSSLDQRLALVTDRIFDLVGKRTNGVWSTLIDVEYKRKFKEDLPKDWPQVLQNIQGGKLRVDSPIEGRFIVTSNDIATTRPPPPASAPPAAAQPTTQQQQHPPQKRPPKIKYPDNTENFWDVYVTLVDSTVSVFLRILDNDYLDKFEDLTTNMELHYFNDADFPSVTNPEIGRLYAAKQDSEWHRVEVVDVKGIHIMCFFIDHGSRELVPSENLKELAPQFLDLAPQAISVRLNGLERFKDSPSAFSEIESLVGRSLVGEVSYRDEDDVAMVLHDTSTDQDVNLNQQFLQNLDVPPLEPPEPMSPVMEVESEAEQEAEQQRYEPSTDAVGHVSADLLPVKELMLPALPPNESYFDINVTLAASPSNFTVQSWADGYDLEKLQSAMLSFYSNPRNVHPITQAELRADRYFAARHSDGSWYRVRKNSMLDESTVAVRFVDYGDFSMVGCEELQVLWSQFRNLPMQAINANLADIIPVNGDWTAPDTVWFSQRVVDKQFVTLIKNRSFNEEEGVVHIGVSLIDTTDPRVDQCVDKELVDKGKAVYLCV